MAKIVARLQSSLNVSFDHEVLWADLDEYLPEDIIEAYEKGEKSGSDLIDLLYRENEVWMDAVGGNVDLIIDIEED